MDTIWTAVNMHCQFYKVMFVSYIYNLVYDVSYNIIKPVHLIYNSISVVGLSITC